MDVSRRSFLSALAGLAAGAGCHDEPTGRPAPATTTASPASSPTSPAAASSKPPTKARSRGVIYGGGAYGKTPSKPDVFKLGAIDIDHQDVYDIPFTFLAHGFAPRPTNSRRGVWFEKKGPGACEVDMIDRRVVRAIEATSGRQFYGHGAYAEDGKTLFVVESSTDDGKGAIVVRDGDSFAVLGEFPTFGMYPHDCHLVDDGRTLAITNGGNVASDSSELGQPSVAFVDIASRKLLEKLTPESDAFNMGHIAVTRSRDIVAVSAPREGLPRDRLGAVTMRSGKGPFRTMSEPKNVVEGMIGETLSVSVHEPSGVVGVTSPAGNQLSFWSLKTGSLIKAIEVPAARGITMTLDGNHFVLSFGVGRATLIHHRELELIERGTIECAITGSHLFAHDPQA